MNELYMYILKYKDYAPNSETYSIGSYVFKSKDEAREYLEGKGYVGEGDWYREGELFGSEVEIVEVYIFDK